MNSATIFFTSILPFFIPVFVYAQNGNVIINEIAWMGTLVEGVEQNQWWRQQS